MGARGARANQKGPFPKKKKWDKKPPVRDGGVAKTPWWRKTKTEQVPFFEDRTAGGNHVSADSLGNEAAPATDVEFTEAHQAVEKPKKETARTIKKRQLNAKRKRRERHDLEREKTDASILQSPHSFLWQQYSDWAGGRLSAVAKATEQWTAEQVCVVHCDGGENLLRHVKAVAGPDYVAKGIWTGGAGSTPGVAVLALGNGAGRAVAIAPRLYDASPVGKLFGKHIKLEEQKAWLRTCCRKGLARTAVGTPKRVQRLVEDGLMTLKHSVLLIVDMTRDVRERNMLDFSTQKEELFDFVHKHIRDEMRGGRLKIMLLMEKTIVEGTTVHKKC